MLKRVITYSKNQKIILYIFPFSYVFPGYSEYFRKLQRKPKNDRLNAPQFKNQ